MTSNIARKARPLPAGIYCPVLSLYKPTPRQEIDYEASYKYFAYLIRGGVDGLVMAGTTAEAVLLSATERQELVRVARRAANDLGLKDFPVVAGISGQSTNESIRLAEEAHEGGADFGLLLPPSYWVKAVTKDVIVDFYREVADNSPIPIVIYSVCATPNSVTISF
jgi:2-keto-3-deoxy-L-rhamnonate aldolase